MSVSEFCEFCELAYQKDQEDSFRAEWVQLLPWMSMKTFKYLSFEEYVNKRTGKNIDMRPTEAIIAEIEALHGLNGGQ